MISSNREYSQHLQNSYPSSIIPAVVSVMWAERVAHLGDFGKVLWENEAWRHSTMKRTTAARCPTSLDIFCFWGRYSVMRTLISAVFYRRRGPSDRDVHFGTDLLQLRLMYLEIYWVLPAIKIHLIQSTVVNMISRWNKMLRAETKRYLHDIAYCISNNGICTSVHISLKF